MPLLTLAEEKGLAKDSLKTLISKIHSFAGAFSLVQCYKNEIALRIEGTFGQIHAYDSILKKVAPSTNGRYERNLSFRSTITEIMVAAEFHPFYIFGNYNDDHYPPAVSPYLF